LPFTPRPVQERIPIWWGLSGPKSLARAAKRGGALFPSPRHTIAELRHHLDVWRENGGEVTDLPVIREVFVAETQAKAEEIAGPAVTYLFRELYGKKSAQGERVLRDDQGNVVTEHDHVDFQNFKSRYIIGTPEFAASELIRYETELGATEIICWMHIPGIRGEDAMRSVELFAREVMPAFSREAAA
jgi:alkanesulfonate monooxygenase SsuD/methylene tetrahydromethanopterin reductase-like flavin-dependent oxidoreductase (luciferase family)